MSQFSNIQSCDVGCYGRCLISHSSTLAGSSDVWLTLGPLHTSIDPDAARRMATHLIEAADAADRANGGAGPGMHHTDYQQPTEASHDRS